MPEKHPKRSRDVNQVGKFMVDLATMDEAERAELQKKHVAKKRPKKPAQRPGKRTISSS